MNMGLDFSEIIVIMALVLIFFGSKEIPNFVRQAARFIAKIRVYSDKVKREISEIGRIDEPIPNYDQEVINKKNALRETYIAKRKGLSEAQRSEKSAAIWRNLTADPAYVKARAVMVYVEMGAEAGTRQGILDMIATGRRVVIPFILEDGSLGIGEITDIDKDLAMGPMNIPVPVQEKQNNFFKSDIQLIVCPAVAFDIYGARLGRGKGSYDRFLKEMKGRVPIYGIAFDCQIMGSQDRLPFAYHDVVMDQVVTESGLLIKKPEDGAPVVEKPSQPAG
jgi:5-formyltetrahydrofolate cyclo-ligase